MTSITAPQAITVANGTAYDAINLPVTVSIETDGNTETSAKVIWDTINGKYDPSVLKEQTVTLEGKVTCPDSIDANNVTLKMTITITISAADIVEAPTANPTAGTYTENQSVELTSPTKGATIYYTTDESEPTISGGVTGGTTKQYTEAISVTGKEGQSITTTIKAIAVKDRMQNSSVQTITYSIEIKEIVNVIRFDGNGKTSGEMKDVSCKGNQSITLPQNTYARDGYTFIGWNTAADGSGTHYYDGDEVSVTQDINLFAMWAKMTVSVISSDVSESRLARGQKAKFNIVIESPETSEKIGNCKVAVPLPEKITLYDGDKTVKPSGWQLSPPEITLYDGANTIKPTERILNAQSKTKVLNWSNAEIIKGRNTFQFAVIASDDISLNDIDNITFKTTLTLNEKANVVQTLDVPVVDAFKITYNANGATSGSAPVDNNYYAPEFNEQITVAGKGDIEKKRLHFHWLEHKIGWKWQKICRRCSIYTR